MALGNPQCQGRRKNGHGRFSQNQENRRGKDCRMTSNALPNSIAEWTMHKQSQGRTSPNLFLNVNTKGLHTHRSTTLPFHCVTQYVKSWCAHFMRSGVGEAAAAVGNFSKMLQSAWDHSENEQERLCKYRHLQALNVLCLLILCASKDSMVSWQIDKVVDNKAFGSKIKANSVVVKKRKKCKIKRWQVNCDNIIKFVPSPQSTS